MINGFCQLISAAVFDKIGVLDEVAFPLGYGEENDMCARAIKAGFDIAVCDNAYVYHAKSKSFGHDTRKQLAKQGSKALKEKHPDVDWSEITREFEQNQSLIKLRQRLKENLENL